MMLVEFTAQWIGDYTQEQKKEYRSIYENEEDWPETNTTSNITIDMEQIAAFNESKYKKVVCVLLKSGDSYNIRMGYEDFKTIMETKVYENTIKKY